MTDPRRYLTTRKGRFPFTPTDPFDTDFPILTTTAITDQADANLGELEEVECDG